MPRPAWPEPSGGPLSHVVLVGLMGSGKSTVGALVAEALSVPLVDNDDVLERRSAASARAVADERGLEALHRRELAVLRWSLTCTTTAVITAAASVAERPDAFRRAVDGHHVVLLDGPPELLAQRATSGSDDHRPEAALERLERDGRVRLPVYLGVAELVVDVSRLSASAAAGSVIDHLAGPDPAARSLPS